MPNWCLSYYTIKGDKEEIEELNNLLNALENASEPKVKSDFGNTWLGCLVDAIGKDWKSVSCRGLYQCHEIDYEENIITLQTETAWTPCNEVFDALCEKYPSLSYWYQSEEPGCGLFWTNDINQEYYFDKYYIQIEGKGDDYSNHYVTSDEELFEYLSECFDKPINSFDEIHKLKEDFEEENEDNFLEINKFVEPK